MSNHRNETVPLKTNWWSGERAGKDTHAFKASQNSPERFATVAENVVYLPVNKLSELESQETWLANS